MSVTVMVTNHTDATFMALAWSYVLLRLCHGLVHLTINKVPVRFFFFFVSNLILLAMWLRLGIVL